MNERAEFHVMGQPLDGAPLHYTASGLNYVYLLNGFTVEDDPDYGRIITIDDEKALHRAIGLYIITRPRILAGAEFRFLRKQMRYTQKALASELGVTEQSVANYEKNKTKSPQSEVMIRLSFLLWVTPEDAHAKIIKELAKRIKEQARKEKPILLSAPPSTDIQRCISKDWQIQIGGLPAITSNCPLY